MSLAGDGEQRAGSGRRWITANRAIVIRGALAAVLVAVFFTAGILVTRAMANFQREQYFEVRRFQAASAAAGLEASDVDSLSGTEADAGTPAFERLMKKLVRIKESDSRIRFVYLMRPQDGEMVFLADAEDPESRDYSPPGQVYFEAKPEEFYPFEGKARADPWVMGPVTDRWGTWISANAYVTYEDGRPAAVLGTDVGVGRALASFNQIKEVGTVFTAVGSMLLALVLLQWLIWSYNRDRRLAARLAMEESMRKLNSELLETDRLKTEFIESVSHELRGPITAVNGAVLVLSSHMGEQLDEDGRRLMDIAETGTARLLELVEDLLDVTRIEADGIAINTEKTDLERLAGDTVKVFEVLADEKGLALEATFAGGSPEADVDPEAVRRVLENLVSNAIKYTESGKISVEVIGGDESVTFRVSDTGRGIPERFRDEVFKKFSRLHLSTDSRERGAGLGLAICSGLVRAHGGSITLESEEGRGSTFIFELPRETRTAAAPGVDTPCPRDGAPPPGG